MWAYKWLYADNFSGVSDVARGIEALVKPWQMKGWDLVGIANDNVGWPRACAVMRHYEGRDFVDAAREGIIRAVCTSSEDGHVLPLIEAVQMLRYEESVSEADRDRRHYAYLYEALEDYAAVCVKEQDG